MNLQQVQWGEAICLVHALFPELSFHIISPEKLAPNDIAVAFEAAGIQLAWKELEGDALGDPEILQELIADIEHLSGQAILICGGCHKNTNAAPFIVPTAELQTFVSKFMEHTGEPCFASDAVIVVPDQRVLFMVKNRRSIVSYRTP